MGKVERVDVVAHEVDVDVGPKDLHDQYAANPDDVGPFNDDQSRRDVPQFVFPRAREEKHKEKPVHPLFQAGTFWCDDDTSPTPFSVEGRDDPFAADSGDVNTENVVEYPTRLAIHHLDGPHHQPVNQLADRPVA